MSIVSSSGLAGQPARLVARELRRAGLVPRVEWQEASYIPAGTVIAVRPEGDIEAGTVVTVTVAAPPVV